ncbi:MAG: type II toxin-antitoxin system prevent-host-death family antitoxin [Anaerolineales bacterium]|nr:type II toxin-antitoxin system prevent-host-death family antitoxin [Anaerolineales bacterium]
MSITISKTDLARNTRDVVDQARKGQTIVVQSYGEEQVVLLDALDYRILRALVAYALHQESDTDVSGTDTLLDEVISNYLEKRISLSKAAELLGLSRFEVMDRFERLGLPLRQGPLSIEDAREEISVARQAKASTE